MTELLVNERAQLAECEAVIERGLQTFVEVGNALLTIRDNRLYRAEWGTFEDYCRERWGMSKTHSNRLIAAAETIETLTPIGVIPQSESVIRPLTSLPVDMQPIIWQQAVASAPNGKVTAAHVQEVVNEYRHERVLPLTAANHINLNPFCDGGLAPPGKLSGATLKRYRSSNAWQSMGMWLCFNTVYLSNK